MHKRSLIIGIGIGIIIGVLLLELFSIGEKSQKQLIDIEQRMNGEEASATPTPIPSKTVVPEAPEAPETPEASLPSEASPSPLESPKPLITPTVEPVQPEEEAVADVKAAAIFRVHPGDSITSTGKRLTDNGLVGNLDEFVEYFKKQSVDIRAGYFYVEDQMELSDLKKLLTSQPLSEAEVKEQISTKGLTLIQ